MAFVVGDIEGRLLLDLDPFQAGLDQARADGAQFASQAFTATLDVDQTRLDAGLTNAAAKIGSLSSDIVLRLNQSILDAQLAAVVAKLEALGPKSVSVDLNTALFGAQLADITAKLDALNRFTATPAVLLDDDLANAALDALGVKLTALGRQTETVRVKIDVVEAAAQAALGSELGRMGGIGGMGGGLAGAGADVGLQELIYGSEPGGFLGKVLSPLTMLSTLFSAQFGSLGSLMGFGPEHLLTTLLGLGGLATGGAMGAGLLGLGSLGKTAIGGGSDSLVSHETLSNVEALITGTEKLTAVIKKVGVTAGLAEGQLATAWQKMTADFDKATGPAQAEVAGIGEQIVKLATDYIPLVAQAAKTNFGIIEAGLKPLFAWLEGSQGKGIFENLEKEFSGELPTTIHAVTQGLELFLRVMNLASTYTGGFTKHLDEWLTRMNGATFGKVSTEVGKLIGDFHLVDDFIKALGKDIVDIFKNDAGTATDVLKLLTHALQELGTWINSIAGKGELQKLFTVHKGETLQLMQSLGDLLVSFGKIYLSVAPYFVELVTDLLTLANAFFRFTQSIPGLDILVTVGTALFIMQERSHLLTNALYLLRSAWGFGAEILTFIRYLQGAGLEAQSASQWMSGLRGAMNVTSAASTKMAQSVRMGMTQAFQDAGVTANNAVVPMRNLTSATEDAGDAAEDAGSGIGDFGNIMGSFIGPAGLIVGAAAMVGGLAAAFIHFGHSGATVKKVQAALQSFNQTLSEMAVTSVLHISSDIINLQNDVANFAQKLATLKPDTTAFTILSDKITAADSKMLNLSQAAANQTANLQVLENAFHLTATQVKQLATAAGVKLNQALTARKVHLFTQAMNSSTTAAIKLKASINTSAHAIAASANQEAKTVASKDQLLVSSMKTALAARAAIAAGTAPRALAALVNATTGGLNAVEAADKQWGVVIPGTIMKQLQAAMGSGGTISMSALIKAVDAKQSDVASALGRVYKTWTQIVTPAKEAAGKVGVTMIDALVKELTTESYAVSSQTSSLIYKALTAAKKTSKTFSLVGAAIAGGIENGILSGSGTLTASIQGLIRHAQLGAMHAAQAQSPSKLFANTVGKAIAQGIALGINAEAPTVNAAMTDAVTQAVAAAKKAGKISSPSMLAADEIGKPLMQGIVEGFRSEIPTANAVITNWANTVPLAFKSAGDKAAASLVFGVRQALTELEALKKTLGAVGTRLVDALANAVSEGSTTIVRVLAKVKAAIAKAMTLKDAATLAAAGFHATLSQSIQTALTNLSQAFAHAKSKIAPSLQKAVSEAIADLTAKSATLGAFAAELAANLAKALQSGSAAKIITAILNIGHATGATGTKGLKGNAGGPATTANAGPGYTAFTGNAGGPATTASANLKYYKTPTTGKWIAYHTTIPAAAAATAATAATVATTAAATAAARIVGITHTTPLKLVGGGTLGKGTPATAKLIGTVGTGLLGGTPLAGTPGVGSTGAGTTGATAGYYSTTAKAVAAYTSAITKANAAVKSLTTAVKLLGTGLSALTKLFTSVTKTITTSLKSGWTKIVSYLSTLPAQMKAIGTQLMAGLATGITAGTSSVVAAMVVAIDKAIAAAKAHAGIKSPSELAATQIGLPLAQGMAEGILRGSSVIGDAAKSALAEALGPTYRPPTFGDYGGSSAPVTHNGPLVSVGQIVLHGVDLSNAGAVQAAVRKGLDEYTDTMQQLLGQQGKT